MAPEASSLISALWAMPGTSRKAAVATINRDVMIILVAAACDAARSGLHRKCAEQRRDIGRPVERPQGLKCGGRLLCRPALAHVAAEFPLHVGFGHRPLSETRRVVHLAGNAPAVAEDRGHACRY